MGRALLWHLTIVGGGVALFALYDVPVGSTISPVEAAETAATLPTDVTLPIAILYALPPRSTRTSSGGQMSPSGDAPMRPPRRSAGAASDDGDEIDDPAGANSPYPTVAATGSVPGNADRPAEVECPHCGKETDADLDFCHWCTEPLPWADAE